MIVGTLAHSDGFCGGRARSWLGCNVLAARKCQQQAATEDHAAVQIEQIRVHEDSFCHGQERLVISGRLV